MSVSRFNFSYMSVIACVSKCWRPPTQPGFLVPRPADTWPGTGLIGSLPQSSGPQLTKY